MLGHLMPIYDGADRERDLGRTSQRSASAYHSGLDACEIALSGDEEFFTFTAALGSQIGIAADHQALVWEIRRRDGSHVALIEQRELQCAALQQPFDRRSTQRGDPVETRRFDLIGDACLCDHTAVTDHHNAIEPEALLQLLDLR